MGLRDKIKANLGVSLPPMISRQGNRFTLRDAAGNERPPVDTIDIVIIDGNGHISKQYRENKNYNPNDPQPPDCFSDNGEAPSVMALKPQSERCVTCQWNARGSEISRVSGAAIKACTDNQKLAVIVDGDEQGMLYQLMITPGSLSNFRAYIKSLEGHHYEPEEVVTRVSFVPKSMGVLAFEPTGLLDGELSRLAQAAGESGAARFVTGEDDQPLRAALPAPSQAPHAAPQLAQAVEREQAPGPTREQLEAQLAKMREEKPKRAPKAEAASNVTAIPAFLNKGQQGEKSFGMVANPNPPPDEVNAMLAQHGGAVAVEQPNPLKARIDSAFKLPVR